MRFSHIIMAYFMIGATMWAGGAIGWGDAGVGKIIMDDPQTDEINNETAEDLEKTGGPIQEAIGSVSGGALLAVWNLVLSVLNFFVWPLAVLIQVDAPPKVVLLLGGTPTIAFYGGFLRLIRTSG